jgi:hypothetical protein
MPLSSSEDFRVVQLDRRKGFGLFANRKFGPGERIYRFDYWSQEQMPIHFTNHSCDPNASFNDEGWLVAAREIEAGEEITFDYTAHPLPASPWNFKCVCGAPRCVGWVDVNAGSRRPGESP